MLGVIVNAVTVLFCALGGRFLVRKGVSGRFEEILKKAVGLALVCIGIKGGMESRRTLLFIMSIVAGGLLGELVDIDGAMKNLGNRAEKKLASPKSAGEKTGNFSRGFVSASILFCAGPMSIVGSIQGGLTGNHETLFAKSVMDGAFALIFGATMGIGAAFSALVILVYQGGIALASMALGDFLTADIIQEMSAAGSLLLCAIGFNFLGVKEIKVANFIPAMFIPCIYLVLEGILAR